MKYLVTGAAGFIAARTCQMLLEQGHEVVGVDNLNDYYDPRLKELRLEALRMHPGFHFQRLDIEDAPALSTLFAAHRFDAVFNLAARAGVRYSMAHPEVYLTTNALGTLHLLDRMRAHGVKKFVLASTSSLYAGQAMPFVETLPVNTPISPYAASKKAAEALAYSYHHLYGFDVSVVRYFTVYGPAGRPDMAVYRFIEGISRGKRIEVFGDGLQARDFTYVDDIARGTIAAVRPLGFETINLGGGANPVELRTLIGLIEAALGKKAEVNHGAVHAADVKATWADIAKAERLLGWKPQVSLEEGVRATVAWHLAHADRAFAVNEA